MTNEKYFNSDPHKSPVRWDKYLLAEFLNCHVQAIQHLIREDLTVPLGKPAKNGKKYWSRDEILALAGKRSWLEKVSECIRINTQKQNDEGDGEDDERAAA